MNRSLRGPTLKRLGTENRPYKESEQTKESRERKVEREREKRRGTVINTCTSNSSPENWGPSLSAIRLCRRLTVVEAQTTCTTRPPSGRRPLATLECWPEFTL